MCRRECRCTCIVQLGRGDVGTSPACHLDAVLSPPTCLLLAYPGTRRCTQRHVVWPVGLPLRRHVIAAFLGIAEARVVPLSLAWPGSYARCDVALVLAQQIVFPAALRRRCLTASECARSLPTSIQERKIYDRQCAVDRGSATYLEYQSAADKGTYGAGRRRTRAVFSDLVSREGEGGG